MSSVNFSPFNPIVKLCIAGMAREEAGDKIVAVEFFQQAWNEASGDFEKYLAGYYLARVQQEPAEKLAWLEKALTHALAVQNVAVQTALPAIYSGIADIHQTLGNTHKATEYAEKASKAKTTPTDSGPFYHGTKANLTSGDLLVPGGLSNYQSELKMNHVYFTAVLNGATLAAALAKGDASERVYIVEPTGHFESDPNLTDKKFPGNPTRSYRSSLPLRIIGEVTEWERQKPEVIQAYREKLENNKGEIIN